LAQVRNMRQHETHLLARSNDFVGKVILERCKVVLEEKQQREKESALMARDHFIAAQPTETELLRRSMKSEIISRFSKLTEALRREDRLQTGYVSCWNFILSVLFLYFLFCIHSFVTYSYLFFSPYFSPSHHHPFCFFFSLLFLFFPT